MKEKLTRQEKLRTERSGFRGVVRRTLANIPTKREVSRELSASEREPHVDVVDARGLFESFGTKPVRASRVVTTDEQGRKVLRLSWTTEPDKKPQG